MTSLDLISQVKQSIAKLTDPQALSADLDLTNCDLEPIHIPSAIQAHGVLITFSEADLTILQISQNCEIFLGKKPTELLGQPLSLLMDKTQFATIESCVNGDFENVNPLRLSLQVNGKSEGFEGIVHRTDGVIVLELERCLSVAADRDPNRGDLPIVDRQAVSFFDFYKFVKTPIDRIQNTQTLAELSQQTVTAIRTLTGFDSP